MKNARGKMSGGHGRFGEWLRRWGRGQRSKVLSGLRYFAGAARGEAGVNGGIACDPCGEMVSGMLPKRAAAVAALAALALGSVARATVLRLDSPGQMSPPLTTIDFEGYPHLTAADTLYESQGVRFSRDDGGKTATYHPASYSAHSGVAFLATPGWQDAPLGSSTHLNVEFGSLVREVGAFFGNDRDGPGVFDSLRLSVFGVAGETLGTVSVVSNRNGDTDQYIGLRSDVPFVRARFEHDAPQYGVAIDDLSFTALPEPSVLPLLALAMAALCRRSAAVGQRQRARVRCIGRLCAGVGCLAVLLASALPASAALLPAASAQVLAGPVANAANGHLYYLLAPDNWTNSEAAAVSLGGHLVTINSQAENAWVVSRFSTYGRVNRGLWIGLTDQRSEGTFEWVSGEPFTYSNWGQDEPNNADAGPGEDWAHILWPGEPRFPLWNDAPDTAVPFDVVMNGVAEVVPEPSSLLLLLGCCAAGLSRRPRRIGRGQM
jgi:hypothetical protein